MDGRARGRPSDDEPVRLGQRLAAVDAAAVAAEANTLSRASDFVLVVAGPAARLRGPLSGLGAVEVVEPAAPVVEAQTPSRATTPPTAEESAAGRRLMAASAEAHGGTGRLASIKDSVVEADVTLVIQGRELTGTLRETRKDPGRYLAAMMVRTNFGQQGLDGNRGWITSTAVGDTVLPADSATVAALRTALGSDVIHLLRAAAEPRARVAARGRERLGGGEAEVVEVVDATGTRRVLFLDPVTHRIIGLEQEEGAPGADLHVRRLLGDHRQVAGVWWPFSEVRTVRGARLMTVQARNVRLNTGVGDEVFTSPGRSLPGVPSRIRR